MAQYVHNAWKNSTTGYSPFELLMGFVPQAHQTNADVGNIPDLATRQQWLTQVQESTTQAMLKAQESLRRYDQRKKGECHYRPFTEGELVLLESTNLNLPHPIKKLAPKRLGPFKIIGTRGEYSYELRLPSHWKVYPVFHASLLRPYTETEAHGPNYTEPPPTVVDDEDEYEVEKLLGSKRKGRGKGQLHYLVCWKGYS
jgi:hypothetical protein